MTSPASPTAFVSGASTGLGYAIACGLAHAGYDLAVTSRDIARLDGFCAIRQCRAARWFR